MPVLRRITAGITRICLIATLGCALLPAADEKVRPEDPELAALREQNALLEQRLRLTAQQQLPAKAPVVTLNQRDEAGIESLRMAYTALAGIAPDVAKDLACAGNNTVLYGPAQTDSLFSLREFTLGLDSLRAGLQAVLAVPAPRAPEGATSPDATPSLASAVIQPVMELLSLFRNVPAPPAELQPEERGVLALVAKAATAQGCLVYWPDEAGPNPFNAASPLMTTLRGIADLNDGGAGKSAGLQQKLLTLKKELARAEAMSVNLTSKINAENDRLTQAEARLKLLRDEVSLLHANAKEERGSALQDKLNKTFEKSWDDLETAVKRQLSATLPGTLEEVGRLGELSKRLDVLKTRTDFLSHYVTDERAAAVQEKMVRYLSADWDQLDAAVKAVQAAMASVPKAVEPDVAERIRWDKYAADLRAMIRETAGASDAYNLFRSALLDGASGQSPLNRLLRAESLRNLLFDDVLNERPGASIVQLKVERLTGTRSPLPPLNAGTKDPKDLYSGGVVLSFMQYQPGGKLKNSGVHTAYLGFKQQ